MGFYVPTHNEFRQMNSTKEIHQILLDYFRHEINEIKILHETWLKYPIQELSDHRLVLKCKENSQKMNEFLEEYRDFKLINKKYINGTDNDHGIIYTFKYDRKS